MRTLTARPRSWRTLLVLPLLLLGICIVPFGLGIPAHGSPDGSRYTATLPVDHDGHGVPSCEAEPDTAPVRPQPNQPVDLTLLPLTQAIAPAHLTAFRAPVRAWPSRPHWRPFGAAFLSFAGISRT